MAWKTITNPIRHPDPPQAEKDLGRKGRTTNAEPFLKRPEGLDSSLGLGMTNRNDK